MNTATPYEGIRRIGNEYQAVITGPLNVSTVGTFKTFEEARDAYAEAMKNRNSEWSLRTVRQLGPNEFQAVVRGPRGLYVIGTFPTPEEAVTAVHEAMTASWNG